MSSLGRRQHASRPRKGGMWGVPFLIKDLNQYMKGTVTTNGCRFYKALWPTTTSTLVARYKAAGLNIFGKTASPSSARRPRPSPALRSDTQPLEQQTLALADPPAVRRRGRRWHLARGACQ
ncbi:hypothetical protein J4714_14385 [Staphylococcus epidermidis]|nr:hypothetical protein [Staphylococcus epidermidis]